MTKEACLASQEALKAEVMAELEAYPFRPPWWLRNCHAQTVWSRYGDRAVLPEMKLERWDTPDDDFVRVHVAEGDEGSPLAILLHGLEGSVKSTYLVRLIVRIRALGWTVVVLEHRSCGGEMNRARRMYHSGASEDLGFVVERLIGLRPSTPIYIAGYSLGANITAKWLGELGDEVPGQVKAAATVSAPFDLLASGPFVDSGVRRLYVLHFLKNLIPKAVEKERQYPGSMDIEAVRRSRTFRDFDHHATAALHGFRDAEDYYRSVACGQFLAGVRRPLLLLSAADDPFNPGHTLPREAAAASPYLHALFPNRGGHVGFVQRSASGGLGYWAEDQIVRFFSAYHGRLGGA